MKKHIITIALLILIESFISETKICLAETGNNSINLSYGYGEGDFKELNQYAVEYEHHLKNTKISLFGRFIISDYEIEDHPGWFGNPGEDGDLKGGDLGIRFYPIGKKRMDKLFIGGACGFFQNDWTESYGDQFPTTDSKTLFRLDTEIGYRFNIGSKRISIIPSVHMDYYSKNSLGSINFIGSIAFGFSF